MAKYPRVQAKIQAELDKIVGPTRLPELEDRDLLPYCQATLLEVLRWRPAVPLGIPHRLMVDDRYDGYHFPAGSLIVAVRMTLIIGLLRVTESTFFVERVVSAAVCHGITVCHFKRQGYASRSSRLPRSRGIQS